jgi:[protein-PII] uridylyltransferase
VRAARDELLAERQLAGAALCRELSALTDRWLADLFDDALGAEPVEGVALVAVGGYGRAELSPRSDLDVVLLHDPRRDVAELANRVWYPVWDEGLKLGHAVRTVPEAVALADGDLEVATSLLDARPVAGDTELAAELRRTAVDRWARRARRRLGELGASVRARHDKAGEVAFLLEPDLKEGRGGLRDVHALRWAEAARAVLLEADLAELAPHHETILAARVELHRASGRPGDRLWLQEQDAVAAALGEPDADALMRRIATAARTIAWTSDDAWGRIESTLRGPGPIGRLVARDRSLGPGLVLRDGRVHLERDADPTTDPTLVLRAAAAAARQPARLDRDALERLATAPPPPEPWPEPVREALVELLLAGHDAIPVVEALAHVGVWQRLLPEWSAVHCTPQRNAYHRFTVDRHLLEAAANAASLTTRVDRPDLLVVGTLLHDIGKGRPGDHTDVGIDLVRQIGPRLGFPPADVDLLVAMVRHHLLLPDVATRRDLADDGTIGAVVDAVGDLRTLRLLDALTEADSLATGPSAWGGWKAGLVRELVDRCAVVLGGGTLSEAVADGFPTDAQRAALAGSGRVVRGSGDTLEVVDDDRPGLFSAVAGALAVSGVSVVAARAHSDAGRALSVFTLHTGDGDAPWPRIEAAVHRALDGTLAFDTRLAERRRAAIRRPRAPVVAPTRVLVDNVVSTRATVLEVHTADRVGVLFRITRALAGLGLDIRSARVQTLGHEVVDAFYVVDGDGRKLLDPERLARVRDTLVMALDRTGD